jgi:hypothetical protein
MERGQQEFIQKLVTSFPTRSGWTVWMASDHERGGGRTRPVMCQHCGGQPDGSNGNQPTGYWPSGVFWQKVDLPIWKSSIQQVWKPAL